MSENDASASALNRRSRYRQRKRAGPQAALPREREIIAPVGRLC